FYASLQRENYLLNLSPTKGSNSSPISNVVNANPERLVYSYAPEQGLKHLKMNRWQSLGFLLKKLGDNFKQRKARLLPHDLSIGRMDFPTKPITVPDDAQYLGGVGDGAWFSIRPVQNDKVAIKRFTSIGELEYVVLGETLESVNLMRPFEITYDSHLLFTHIKQNGRKIRINHVCRLKINSVSKPKEHTLKYTGRSEEHTSE